VGNASLLPTDALAVVRCRRGLYDARPDELEGAAAMMLIPAMMVGSQLLIVVVDKVPALNFEPICREAAGDNRVGTDDVETCRKGESAARDQLAKQWSEFDAADRARCVRLSSSNRTASYVEVLTCLEMNQAARKLHPKADTAIALPEQTPMRELESPAVQNAQSRPPAPAAAPASGPLQLTPPAPPAASSRILEVLCVPGLKSILPACQAGGSP
jgi:hypothetical protein